MLVVILSLLCVVLLAVAAERQISFRSSNGERYSTQLECERYTGRRCIFFSPCYKGINEVGINAPCIWYWYPQPYLW